MNYYRQGDVDIIPTDKVPAKAKKLAQPVLAEGELTGHHHRFLGGSVVDVFLAADGVKYLQVHQPSPLVHEEHDKIIILPGTYKVEIEREYSYEDQELSKVKD